MKIIAHGPDDLIAALPHLLGFSLSWTTDPLQR